MILGYFSLILICVHSVFNFQATHCAQARLNLSLGPNLNLCKGAEMFDVRVKYKDKGQRSEEKMLLLTLFL